MDYFRVLNLVKEPFSNSPDPEFFFQSEQHVACLQQIEISLRLRRGLNVVIGDVGAGKTTLCRELIRKFAADEDTDTHLILDPNFSNSREFLTRVAEMFDERQPPESSDEWQLKEIIKKHLFQRGVDENKNIILIIDEGQKIPEFCLEILREFLNYEINEFKLLQIVIFAQKEFEDTVRERANFADRINLYHILKPMSFSDTRAMIRFRLERSSEAGTPSPRLFTFPALYAIYRASGGYPRKIINLCHQCVLSLIVQNRSKAGWSLVRSCANRTFSGVSTKREKTHAIAVFAVLALIALIAVLMPSGLKIKLQQTPITENRAGVSASTGHNAVSESTEESSAEETLYGDSMPDLLGRVTLRERETLFFMIKDIYGTFTPHRLRAVKQANPGINDPGRLGIGQTVTFPAIPVKTSSLALKAWWVQIAEKNSLEAALRIFRELPDNSPPARFVPYWNRKKGLRFAVMLKEHFPDKATAQTRLDELPQWAAPEAGISSFAGGETIFFANPLVQP